MKTVKPLAALLGALSLSSQTTSGQGRLELEFRDEKIFQITGPAEFEYLGGEWIVEVIDGVFPLLPCFANFGQIYQPPVSPGCDRGTTTLITQGDVDGDGVRDLGIYLSTEQPIPAFSIKPFSEDLIELFAAPPSDLPRPIAAFNWTDQSIRGFFDIVGDPLNGVAFDLAFYRSTRTYLPSEIGRHRDEIVPGVYQFKFPALRSTVERPGDFFMSIAHREMVEAAPGPGGQSVESGGIYVGNDFLLEDERWFEGAIEIDPRLGFEFNWEGFNAATFFGNDELSFAVRERDTGLVRFPPVPFPEFNPDTRQLIGSSQLGIPTGINIGSGFFAPNESLVAELEFRRDLVDGASVDRSGRFFRWDIELIDSYQGFTTVGFPLGTTVAFTQPEFDFDGDGFTNLEEFGLQTDPADPASVPDTTPFIDDVTQQCALDIPKRPAIGSTLTYLVQYSLDLENWITIEQGDPNWFIVFDNEELISVLSRRQVGTNPCFLRVRFEQN